MVGILRPLPRTLHVFEEQTKWPLDRDPWEPGLLWVPNYGSASDHLDFAREKFEEEIKEGMMEKLTMKEFVDKYGDNRAIAALAVIVEDEDKGRRFKHRQDEHGYLACQIDGDGEDSPVYINKVGTFGVNCASYWWTRISAAGLRATHHLIGPCPLDMLLCADDLESLAEGRIGIVLSYSSCLL